MTDTVRALTCPQCGGTIALRATGVSVTLVCEHCGTTLDTTGPELRILAAAHAAMRRPPIALGTRGELDGVLWEAVGYLERSDGSAYWSEYLLFNPYEGYAFLVDDGRRFSLGRLLDRMPDAAYPGMRHDGVGYRQFGQSYEVTVRFVVGEFYWRVAVGETVRATNYVTPGAMLACEESDSEQTWTHLRLLHRGRAEAAFGIDPRATGWGTTPSPHEPSPWWQLLREALVVAAIACVALVIIASGGASVSRIAAAAIDVALDAPARTTVVGPIALTARYSRVSIAARADTLDNMWVDLDYALVDRRTQASFDAYATAEDYNGSDSDGRWREGNGAPVVTLAAIPRGTYDLVVEASAKRWTGTVRAPSWGATDPAPTRTETVPVAITVDRGGTFGGNIALAMLLIALWPACLAALHWSWEARRMAPVTGDD